MDPICQGCEAGRMYFVSCRLYLFYPQPPRLIPVISLFLTTTVWAVRACLSIWWERFRESQKEDERGPLSIQSKRPRRMLVFRKRNITYNCTALCVHQLMEVEWRWGDIATDLPIMSEFEEKLSLHPLKYEYSKGILTLHCFKMAGFDVIQSLHRSNF